MKFTLIAALTIALMCTGAFSSVSADYAQVKQFIADITGGK